MTPTIDTAVARLRAGGVVAFPTETVYGLGADALREPCVQRVYDLKGRTPTNPMIVHVANVGVARESAVWTDDADRLASAFWPGPLTIVLEKRDVVPAVVTAGGPTVAVRVPAHPMALALLTAFGGPLVGPSANRSGRVSPTTTAHVRSEFASEDVSILDGGPCSGGIESTVVDISGEQARVLRPGLVNAASIADVLGRPVKPHGLARAPTGEPVRSPGVLGRHYAPTARTILFDMDEWTGIRQAQEGPIVVLAQSAMEGPLAAGAREVIAMPKDPHEYARVLYARLRRADALSPALIAIERPPARGANASETAVWEAIADRLGRASQEPPTVEELEFDDVGFEFDDLGFDL